MEQLINFIIRPPRAEYNPENDLLDQEFKLKGKLYQRKDLEAVNSAGNVLQCSHYVPVVFPQENPLPCVIYCHGNSGCRTDANEAAVILLPLNITVFALDFSGSGLSGGDYVTLGWNEKDDLKAVVRYLRSDGNVSSIGLWGRSMGAVTSLMYGAEDPSIAGMVLDSPFSDLVELMTELVDTFKVRLPKFTIKFAIQYLRRAIQKKARFDITDLNTIKVAKTCLVPVLLGHATDDNFIQPHHSDSIFDAYMGEKNIIKFEGDHNSLRPQFYFNSVSIFFNNVLQPPEDEGAGNAYFDLSCSYFDKVPTDMSNKYEQTDDKVESSGSDSQASSSTMISFELSRPGPQGYHVPVSIDDDEYVEYSLDALVDSSSNTEEEEEGDEKREAMLESMRGLNDAGHTQVDESSSSCGSNVETKPAQQNAQRDSFSTLCDLKTKLNSISEGTEHKQISNPNQSLKYSLSPATYDHSVPDANGIDHTKEVLTVVNDTISNGVVSHPIGEQAGKMNHRITPSGNDNSSEVDMVDRTKVTLKVVKSPPNNILDSLLRRWDFNFFRNR